MGITISTTATSPFFLTTGIIGLLSFAFTLATFLRVTHQNISTLLSAPHEVHSYLTNLRQELLEERTSLKFLRKACKTRRKQHSRAMEDYLDLQLDTATIKTMTDAVRQMIKQFQTLEKPFLEAGEEGIGQVVRRRSRSRRSPYYPHEAYNSPPYEKRAEEEDDDEVFWPERVRYCDFTLRRRLQWLRRKSQAQGLFEQLSRVQTRRIARQVGGVALMMEDFAGTVVRVEGSVLGIEERVNRVIGVRRVD
jgi:hypothetical protein